MPCSTYDTAVVRVSKLARLVKPGPVPACMTYDVGVHPPTGAVQARDTADPVTLAVRLVGAPGSPEQAPGVMFSTISLDAGPGPAAFFARTRT